MNEASFNQSPVGHASGLVFGNYKKALAEFEDKADLVFLDPPYAGDMVEDAIARMMRADILADYAIVVCESNKDRPFEADGFQLKRFAKYSKTYLTILVKDGEDTDGN